MLEANSTDPSKNIFWVTSLASILSGTTARLFCHPLDTIKAILQVDIMEIKLGSLGRNLILKTAKDTLKNEGIKGLYEGIGIATLGSIPALAIYFTSYEISKSYLSKMQAFRDSNAAVHLVSGFIAETFSCILLVPIDVIKERLQVQSKLKTYSYNNAFDAITTIAKHEGIRGLYKAYGATLLSFGPFSALYFMFYEKLKEQLVRPNQDMLFLKSLTLSGLSGALAGTLTNPLDMVKLRMQVQRAEKAAIATAGAPNTIESRFGYKNVFHGIYKIYTTEGFLSLFKGSLARIMYYTPVTAITMSVLEVFRNQLLRTFGYKQN